MGTIEYCTVGGGRDLAPSNACNSLSRAPGHSLGARRRCLGPGLAVALLGLVCSAQGQWLSQRLDLVAGWNAIYLAVQPSPTDCDSLFANLPIAGVYRHNARRIVAQFDTDPDNLFARPDEWLMWVPKDGMSEYIRTLNEFIGDSTYLVKATTNCTLVVVGQPVLPRLAWIAGSANMAGFQLNPAADQQPTFADFFRYQSGIDAVPDPGDERIYTIDALLQHQNITGRTSRQKMVPGQAYWIYAQGLSDYVGGVEIVADDPGGLIYGTDYSERILRLRNVYGADLAVTVAHLPSAAPPDGTPTLAGPVPLRWADRTAAGWTWRAWSTTEAGQTRTLAAGETWEIRLALDRGSMSEPSWTNALWQSLVRVSASCGSYHHVPVSAAFSRGTDQLAPFPYGLWVGQADLTLASFVGFDTNAAGESPTAPLPVSSPFPLRLILHAGSDGSVKLLERALVATLNDATGKTVNRLFTDESHVPANASVATRLSSPAFGRIPPVPLTGTGFLQSVAGTFVVGYDDPANPFKHLYHPDHDNKNAATGARLAEGVESFSITNLVRLTWSATNATPGPFTALWNPDETTTGTFEQVISNLRHVPITVRGDFVLKRVSRVAQTDQ